jgi:outer membrane biosynthesis protein TonB
MPIGAWVAIAGAGAFGITLAAMVGARMLQAPPTQVAAVAPAPAETPTLAPPTAAVDVPGPGELPAGPATPETDPPAAAVAADNGAASGRPAGGGGTKRGSGGAAAPGGGTKQLSDADRALLEQMGGGGPTPSASLQNLARTAGQGADTGGPQLPELSAEMLRSTLTRNRQSLQSCYELAARQTGSTDTMRVDVSIVVGGSGTVTRVTADGNGPPQLNSCIQTAVRRWRFPGSGEATFPLVFSPGAR